MIGKIRQLAFLKPENGVKAGEFSQHVTFVHGCKLVWASKIKTFLLQWLQF